jgi:Skp family chaperone for outer membrane proteins
MKKTYATALLLALAAAGTAFAQEPRAPRLAVIDMARVSAESALGKTYAAQLEKLNTEIQAAMTQKQTELGKMDSAIKALQDELEKQGSVLSVEAREKKQVEITRRTRERNAFLEDGQGEINRMRERATQQAQQINNEFQIKVRPVIEQIAKEKGFDLIIDSQIAYSINRDFDITPQVIARAEEAKPAAAAPAAPKPAAPKPAAPKP